MKNHDQIIAFGIEHCQYDELVWFRVWTLRRNRIGQIYYTKGLIENFGLARRMMDRLADASGIDDRAGLYASGNFFSTGN